MFKNKLFLLLSFVVITANFSCYKDSDFESVINSESQQPEILSQYVGSILGYVYDEDGLPITDAQVSIYSSSTTTNEFGVFEMVDVNLDQHGTYLKVIHPDFVLGSDFIRSSTGIAQSRVQMIKLVSDNTFDSNEGKLIEIKEGGTIEFMPESIIDSQGNDYAGTVEVTSRLLAEDDEKLSELMPGGLVAQDKNGKTVVLGTAGMVAIELRSPSGDELNIKPGSFAIISIPIENSDFPNEIPTWSFDENTGRWQEEGIAIKKDGFYVYEVSHLSFWNCDYPFDLISVSGRVLTATGEPVLTNVGVRSSLYGVEYALTDTDGFFSGKVPANEELEFFVLGIYCSNGTFRKDLGPFDATTVLEDFIVDRSSIPIISGEVKCSGVPYSDATIIIEADNDIFIYNIIENGNFGLNPNLICNDLTTGLIWAYDNATNISSPKIPIDFQDPIMPVLDVCEVNCDIDAELSYICGNPQIAVFVNNPNGTYTYNWSSGETTNIINVPPPTSDLLCVTVTQDLTGCELSFCQETSNLNVSVFADECSGVIQVSINDGSPPYSITNTTTGEITETNSSNFSFPYWDQGTYCFDVSDKAGCEILNECEFAPEPFQGSDYIDNIPFDCSLNRYYYNGSFTNIPFVFGPQGSESFQIDGNGFYINVANIGYKDISVDFQSACGFGANIETPFFEGLGFDATATNATCITCNDAQISFTVDTGANCIDCDFGEVKIFDNNFNDVTLDNTNALLGIGIYYVAALDLNTGCFIASQEIQIIND